MNLQEQILKIQSMMGVINESKIDNFFYDHFDKVFDKLTLNIDSEDLGHKWLDMDGNFNIRHRSDRIIFSRNHWGVFWIDNCEAFKQLKFPQRMLGVTHEVFEEKLLEYLNKKYGYYKIHAPLKEIGNELHCEEEE
jgi:hypothetical protein